MASEAQENALSPASSIKLFGLSDASSERARGSPTLFAVAQSSRTNPHTTTDESVTTFEEDSSDSAATRDRARAVPYAFEGPNVVLESQVTDERLFHFIAKQYQEDASNLAARAKPPPPNVLRESNHVHEGGQRRRKQQVSVRYKRQGRSSLFMPSKNRPSPLGSTTTFDENLSAHVDRLSVTLRSGQQLESWDEEAQRLSLTCHNPIAIIQDLSYESENMLPDTAETQNLRSRAKPVGKKAPLGVVPDPRAGVSPRPKDKTPRPPANRLSAQTVPAALHPLKIADPVAKGGQDHVLERMAHPKARTLSAQIDDLVMQNVSLKQRVNEQELLLESRTYSLECSKEAVARAKTQAQLLEEENAALARQLQELTAVTSTGIGVNTSFATKAVTAEHALQTEVVPTSSMQTQTESTRWEQLVEKMKEEIAVQAQALAHYEKEKVSLASTLEKQQQALSQAAADRNASVKHKKLLEAEVLSLKQEAEKQKKTATGLSGELKDAKARLARLESEHKVLREENGRLKEEITIIEEQPTEVRELADKLAGYEQLSVRLAADVETQKRLAEDAQQRLQEVGTQLEEQRQVAHKRSGKIRALKQERDMLNVELLKVKQVYSDKCDNYREIRSRLHSRLKQKDQQIVKLQGDLDTLQQILKPGPDVDTSWQKKLFRGSKEAAEIPLPLRQSPRATLGTSHEALHEPAHDPGVESGLEAVPKECDQPRSKSLENTAKHAFKDLAGTLRQEELPQQLKKKLEGLMTEQGRHLQSDRSPVEAKGANTPQLQPSTDKAVTDNVTDKSKSFYSDDTNAFADPKTVPRPYTPRSSIRLTVTGPATPATPAATLISTSRSDLKLELYPDGGSKSRKPVSAPRTTRDFT